MENLEQLVEEGYVICPFLQGCLKERECLVDASCVSTKGLVFQEMII